MSVSANGTSSISQSMNGLSDVNATSITADTITATTITADTVKTQNILAAIPVNPSNVYTTSSGTINLGSLSGFINIGSSCPSIYIGNATSTVKTQNIISYDGTSSTNLFTNMSLTSNLTISANRTGLTNFYAGTDFNLFANAQTIQSILNSTKKTLSLDNNFIQESYCATTSTPSVVNAYITVDNTSQYTLFCAKWAYNYAWDKYVIDGQSIGDTIIQSYYASGTNYLIKSATITVENGSTTDNQGDMTINSGTLTISGQTTNNIGTGATTTNNIGNLTILDNKISATSTNILLGDPLKPEYTYPIPAAHIGGTVAGSAFATGTMTTGTAYTLSAFTSMPAGAYMVSANVPVNCTVAGLLTKINITIQTSGGTIFINSAFQCNGTFTVGTFNYPVTTVVTIAAATTVNLIVVLTFSTGTFTRIAANGLFTALRIG